MQHAVTGRVDQLVIEAVVRIAQGLGKETIAEFVTDGRTSRLLQRLGVDYVQGEHVGLAMPLDRMVDPVGDHRARSPRRFSPRDDRAPR